MPLDDDTLDSFEDDHGRPFAAALRELRGELGESSPGETVRRCIEILAAEAESFGRVRAGDAAPALRILALDGALTEALGDAVAGGSLGSQHTAGGPLFPPVLCKSVGA